jgi:hypothetical protein
MPRKEYDYLPKVLECQKGHLFTEDVLHKLHYVEGFDWPVQVTIPAGALDDVRCQVEGCGSPPTDPNE